MGELEGVSKGGWRPKVCKWEAGEQDALQAAGSCVHAGSLDAAAG